MSQSETALAKVEAVLAPGYTREQIDLIKQTIAPGATDAELQLLLYQAHKLGLDPLLGQIHSIGRRVKEGDHWVARRSIQIGIDGFRAAAQRTGAYGGQELPEWCGPDGVWVTVWLASDYPAAARVGVIRQGWDKPVWGVARWASYAQTKSDGSLISTWAKMPDLMIAKCAEALAFRKAFPDALSNTYIPEETATFTVDSEPGVDPVETPPGLAARVNQAAEALALGDPQTAPEAPADVEVLPFTPAAPPAPPQSVEAFVAALKALGASDADIQHWVEDGPAPQAKERLRRAWAGLTPQDGVPF